MGGACVPQSMYAELHGVRGCRSGSRVRDCHGGGKHDAGPASADVGNLLKSHSFQMEQSCSPSQSPIKALCSPQTPRDHLQRRSSRMAQLTLKPAASIAARNIAKGRPSRTVKATAAVAAGNPNEDATAHTGDIKHEYQFRHRVHQNAPPGAGTATMLTPFTSPRSGSGTGSPSSISLDSSQVIRKISLSSLGWRAPAMYSRNGHRKRMGCSARTAARRAFAVVGRGSSMWYRKPL
ncbi:hypothetical protein DFJ74DRAFT_410796 [Hyaloraphidium curvatum]|nr:hypothetical protein DFJ74DRAFT_410796 [Hyaloraphidium curvatum]